MRPNCLRNSHRISATEPTQRPAFQREEQLERETQHFTNLTDGENEGDRKNEERKAKAVVLHFIESRQLMYGPGPVMQHQSHVETVLLSAEVKEHLQNNVS